MESLLKLGPVRERVEEDRERMLSSCLVEERRGWEEKDEEKKLHNLLFYIFS